MAAEPVVVITGGTEGVGQALVRRFVARGVQVVTCARRPRELPGATVVAADVTRAEDRARLVTVARARGGVVGLINNAAIQRPHRLAEGGASPQDLEVELHTNLLAPIALGQMLLGDLAAHGGFLANVSSGLAYVPHARAPVYCATKAGLSHYTRSAQRQHPGVRLVEIVLPMVDTAMTRGRGRGKLSADEAARQIVAGLDAGRETIWVGKARLLPWLLRLVPGLITDLLGRAEHEAPSV